MWKKLTKDLIFEASFDDEIFVNLPLIFIREFKARSMIFHLLSKNGGHKITADSGYWSKEQLEAYSKRYFNKDPLLKARLLPQNINRICNVTRDLVPVEILKESQIYLEHHRYYNDDLTHAIGGCFRFARGDFAIGIHRGSHANEFGDNETAKLEYYSQSIVQMLMTRAEFQAIRTENQALGIALKTTNTPYILLDSNLEIISKNELAEDILGRFFAQKPGEKKISDSHEIGRKIITAASRILDKPTLGEATILIPEFDDIQVDIKNVFSRTGSPQVLLVFRKCPLSDDQLIFELQTVHKFSSAEAEVAILVSDGKRLEEIAKSRGTTVNTVKTQIQSIYDKIGEAKQTKLATLVSQLRKK